jgi:drug/metabolite transporter (DMT)-like permease
MGLPHAEPLTFLSVRFALAAGALGIWAVVAGSPWPTLLQSAHLALVGVLLHGAYLGGVFVAIWLGVEAGVSALVVSLQPILTAVLAYRVLGERMTRMQWIGLALGLTGVALVVSEKLAGGLGDLTGIGLCIMSLLAISVATLYQKRFCAGAPMRSGAAIQFAAALAALAPLALLLETNRIDWTGEFAFALGWLVVVLSLGAVGLLMVLIRQDSAGRVASLFFLMPPCTAIMGWAFFGETFGIAAMAGIVIAVSGVAMVMRGGT